MPFAPASFAGEAFFLHCVTSKAACWHPDREFKACCACDAKFGLTTRRHHCRADGHVYCDTCAPTGAPVFGPSVPDSDTRCCKTCIQLYQDASGVIARTRTSLSISVSQDCLDKTHEYVENAVSDFTKHLCSSHPRYLPVVEQCVGALRKVGESAAETKASFAVAAAGETGKAAAATTSSPVVPQHSPPHEAPRADAYSRGAETHGEVAGEEGVEEEHKSRAERVQEKAYELQENADSGTAATAGAIATSGAATGAMIVLQGEAATAMSHLTEITTAAKPVIAAVSSAAVSAISAIQKITPSPIKEGLAALGSLVGVAASLVTNLEEAARLSRRAIVLNLAIVENATTSAGFTMGQIAAIMQLREAVEECKEFLIRFIAPDKSTFLKRAAAKLTLISDNADDFAEQHSNLTSAAGDLTAALVMSQALKKSAEEPDLDAVKEALKEESERTRAALDDMYAKLSEKFLGRTDGVIMPARLSIDQANVIGQGGMATVYAGILDGNVDVAVKHINGHHSDAVEQMVRDEVKLTMNARHPRVVDVKGIVVCSGEARSTAIVFERLAFSLDDLIHHSTKRALDAAAAPPPAATKISRDFRISNEDRFRWTCDIIAAMDHLHYNLPSGFHTTHNDLKPQNVMVTHDRQHAKLIDFGVSRERVTIQSHTRGATATGTLAYMPPEAFDHTVEPTNATDVYAFGVLLYELWTGELPWAGLGDAAIISAVTAGRRPEIPTAASSSSLPPAIHCLIEQCWHQDPSERPTFATLKEIRTKQGPILHDAEATAWPKFMRLHCRDRGGDGGERAQATPTDSNATAPTEMPTSAYP